MAGACSCWMPTFIPLSHSRFRSYTMVQRWQVERMALCFLSPSHKQTGEKLDFLSLSFPVALSAVTIAQIVGRKHWMRYSRGAGQSCSHTSFCCQLCLRSPPMAHGWAFPSPCLEPPPRSRSSSFGSVAFQLYSLSLGYRDWKSQPTFT